MFLWIPKPDRCASLSASPQTGSQRPSAPSPVTRNQVQPHPLLDQRTPPSSTCPLRLPTPRLEHPNAHAARTCRYHSTSAARRRPASSTSHHQPSVSCSLRLHPLQILGISRQTHMPTTTWAAATFDSSAPPCQGTPRLSVHKTKQPAPPPSGALPAQATSTTSLGAWGSIPHHHTLLVVHKT